MNLPVQEYKLKIIEIVGLPNDVKTFRVEVPKGIEINFYPGQFFMVRFEDDKVLQRAYSIASSPAQKNYLDITMDLIAKFTKKLWQTKVNDYLIFKGPYGKFYFTDEVKNNLVLIGGGLGITPLMSIIRYCNDRKLPNRINLIYSVRTPQDIVYYEEIKKQKTQNPNFFDTITITRPAPEDNWNGRTGRINISLLKENIYNVKNSLYYICGSLDFVKAIRAMLESLGIKREQIKTDIWG